MPINQQIWKLSETSSPDGGISGGATPVQWSRIDTENRVFRDGDREYLTRTWLTDPDRVEEVVERKQERGSWNGEAYVSFGRNEKRDWEEARRYGFISGGGARKYWRPLSRLEPGDRVWVNVPSHGYAGVGIVEEPACPIDEFTIDPDGVPEGVAASDESQVKPTRRVPIRSLPINAARHPFRDGDLDSAEHFVRVRWLKSVPLAEAVREKGFFGNQNTAAKPRTPKWAHTIERLKERFGVE